MPVLVRSHPLPSSRIVHDRRAASSPPLLLPSRRERSSLCINLCAHHPPFVREFSLSSRPLTHRRYPRTRYFRQFSHARASSIHLDFSKNEQFFSPLPVTSTNIRTIRTYPPRIRLLNDLESGRRIFHEMTVDVALNHPE